MSEESLKVSDIDAVIFVPLNEGLAKGLKSKIIVKNNIILIEGLCVIFLI